MTIRRERSMGMHRARVGRTDETPPSADTADTPPAAGRKRPGLTRLLSSGAFVMAGVVTVAVVMHADAKPASHAVTTASAVDVTSVSPTPTAAGTTSDGSGGSGGGVDGSSPTPDATTTPLPPAPDGFAASVEALYGSMRATAVTAAVPGQPDLPAQSEVNADIDSLSPSDLAVLYAVTQQTPNWSSLPSDYATAQQAAPAAIASAGGPTAIARATSRARATHAATGSVSGHALPAAPTATATATQDYEPDSTPAPFVAGNCPEGAPGADEGEDSLFATQLAVDVLTAATSDVPGEIVAAFGNVTIPDPVKIVLGALLLAAQIIHDTFDYLQSVAGDCSGDNQGAELDNIDNTTYNDYSLLSEVGQTTNEIDSNVAKLLTETQAEAQQQLTLDLEAALAAPTGSVPMVAAEIPAKDGGFLDAQPVGVQAIVTDALETLGKEGQPVSPLASRTLVRADQALGASQYKAAWALFRQTYAYIAD